MKTWVRKTLSVGVLAAGALLFAPTAAQADLTQVSAGNDGILNGTQIAVPIQIPVNVCGNGVGVIGIGVGVSGVCANGAVQDVDYEESARAESSRTEDTTQFSWDNDGIANGTQVYVPVQVPINVCGNGVGVIGVGLGISGACLNGAVHDVDVDEESAPAESSRAESSRTEDTTQFSGDNDGIANGTQVYVPVQVPINICGNGVGVIGVGVGLSGACFNGAIHDADFEDEESSSRTEDLTQVSADNDGILNGTQVAIPIQVPINVCGNGVGVIGVGVGLSGACLNGAGQDIDHHNGNGHNNGGNNSYKKHKKDRLADEESLPLIGDLASLGGQTGSSLGGTTQNLPVAGALGSGVKTSKINVGGVDPTALMSHLPA